MHLFNFIPHILFQSLLPTPLLSIILSCAQLFFHQQWSCFQNWNRSVKCAWGWHREQATLFHIFTSFRFWHSKSKFFYKMTFQFYNSKIIWNWIWLSDYTIQKSFEVSFYLKIPHSIFVFSSRFRINKNIEVHADIMEVREEALERVYDIISGPNFLHGWNPQNE